MSNNICNVGITEYNINEPAECDIFKMPNNQRDTIHFFKSLPQELEDPNNNQFFIKKGDIVSSNFSDQKKVKVYVIGDKVMNKYNTTPSFGASPNIFSGKLNEYNTQFYLIMENFKEAFIRDAITYNSSKQRDGDYMNIETSLDSNNANLFKFSNELEKDQIELLKRLEIKGKELNQLRKKNDNLKERIKNHTNDNDVAVQQSRDKQLTYNLNNIIMFNYLLGIVLCIYILKNL